MESAVIGGIAGASTAELITLPICTVKTVYQSKTTTIPDSIKSIYNRAGILGFYKASSPAVAAQIFASSYKIILFNFFRDYCHFINSQSLIMLGMIISSSCIIFTHPIDYLRIRIQNNSPIVYRDIYKGFSANLAKNSIAGGMYLPLRQILKNNFSQTDSWKLGALSAAISTTVVHPFDYFKTYMIGAAKNSKIPWRNPYKGLTLNLARIIPHFVIMTEVSDKTLGYLKAT